MTLLIIIFRLATVIKSSKVITGYYCDNNWGDIDMKLWTFKSNSYEEISTPYTEIFGSGKCVKAVEITHNKNIEYLPVKVYEKFPNLAGYSAYNSLVKEIRYENFENLFKLQIVVLQNNQISNIPKDTFKDLRSLKFLFMDNNKIKSIDDRVFKNLESLKKLNFDNNEISLISKNAFVKLTELEKIYLSGNLLSTLDASIFSTNQKLEEIWLKNNKIKSLSSTIFDNIEGLKYVDIQHNLCIDGYYHKSGFAELKNKIRSSC